MKPVVAILVGAALGVLGARVFFVGSALSLIPWGLAGLALGAWASTLRQGIALGSMYGFALAFVFMVAGYGGTAPLVSRLLPFAVLGLVGAICGLGLGALGYALRSRFLA